MLTSVKELEPAARRLKELLSERKPQNEVEKMVIEHFEIGEKIGSAHGLSPLSMLVAILGLTAAYKDAVEESDASINELMCSMLHIAKVISTAVLIKTLATGDDEIAKTMKQINEMQEHLYQALKRREN